MNSFKPQDKKYHFSPLRVAIAWPRCYALWRSLSAALVGATFHIKPAQNVGLKYLQGISRKVTPVLCALLITVPLQVNAEQGGTGAGAAPAAERTEPALEPFPAPEFDQFYIASDFVLPATRKVFVSDVQATFADVWLERFRSTVASGYRENTLRNYAEAFGAELRKALEKSGWTVTDSQEPGALRLNPRIFDIYIAVPETPGIKQSIVAQIGQAACELEFNTPDGRAFMKIVDYRNTPNPAGSPFTANRATNYRYFRMLMSDWADSSVRYLDHVMAIGESQKP